MKTTPTLEQVIDAIQEPVIRGLLTTWRINREITTEKLSVMTYRQLRSQLGPKSIHRLCLECWDAVSPGMAWMKDHEKRQEKRLSPIEVAGFNVRDSDIKWEEINTSVAKMQISASSSIKHFLKKFRKKEGKRQHDLAYEIADDAFPRNLPREKRLHLLFLLNQRLQFDGVLFRFKFIGRKYHDATVDLVFVVGRHR